MGRRRHGFGQLADVAPQALGLPARRARELRLRVAWRRIAGATVAARAPAVAVRRGVLEIRRPDEPWLATLEPLLPGLAARLAAREPSLGIERLRVRAEGERGAPAAELGSPDEPDEPVGTGPASADRRPRPRVPSASAGTTPTIERVRELYLARRRRDQKA